MPGLYKAEVLVIREREYGEADKLLTLYSPSRGKIGAIAKGVRRLHSTLRPCAQLFVHSDVVLYAGQNLHTLTQGRMRESFDGIAADWERFRAAEYLAELVDAFIPSEEADPRAFTLLLTCLRQLNSGVVDAELVLRWFEIRFLSQLGYQPRLQACAYCGQGLEGQSQPVVFSPQLGGVLCSRCAPQDPAAMAISAGSVAVLHHFLMVPLAKLERLKLSVGLRKELGAALARYIEVRLEKRLKSPRLLAHKS